MSFKVGLNVISIFFFTCILFSCNKHTEAFAQKEVNRFTKVLETSSDKITVKVIAFKKSPLKLSLEIRGDIFLDSHIEIRSFIKKHLFDSSIKQLNVTYFFKIKNAYGVKLMTEKYINE